MIKLFCWFVFAAPVFFGAAVNAQTVASCAAFAQVLGLHLPDEAPELDGPECTEAQITAWFRADLPAIFDAQPATEISETIGVWISDNHASQLLAEISPGQEVLRITPGTSERFIRISQQYYKEIIPSGGRFNQPMATQFRAQISSGELVVPSNLSGQFRPDFEHQFQYENQTFEIGRAEQLLVLDRLNHFEYPLQFRISGNRLVMQSQQIDLGNWRRLKEVTHTYVRVAAKAPDQAMRLVRFFGLSQTLCFVSFTHQLSDGRGPLVDAFGPYSANEMLAFSQQFMVLQAESGAMMQLPRGSEQSENTRSKRIRAIIQEMDDLEQQPISQHIQRIVTDTAALGCLR